MSQNNKGVKSEQKDYTIELKYSPKAIKEKLIKFTTKEHGDSFEMSAEELISLLVNDVNMEKLAPAFVETEKINVVQVQRQIKCRLDKDMKAGEEINVNYIHPYPLEYALIEESFKIAQIEGVRGVMELTKEFIEKCKSKLQPEMEEFTKKFYKSFNQLDLEKKK